jgi:hypothetical protein
MSTRFLGNPAHGEVKRWRGSTVQLKFALTEKESPRRRRKIDVGQPNGTFEFENAAANEHDDRNVGFDCSDVGGLHAIGFGIAEKLKGKRLIFDMLVSRT